MNQEMERVSILINLELLDLIKKNPDLFYILCWSMVSEQLKDQETFDDILFRGFDTLKSEMIEKVETTLGEIN